jgi:hypothetical protein
MLAMQAEKYQHNANMQTSTKLQFGMSLDTQKRMLISMTNLPSADLSNFYAPTLVCGGSVRTSGEMSKGTAQKYSANRSHPAAAVT